MRNITFGLQYCLISIQKAHFTAQDFLPKFAASKPPFFVFGKIGSVFGNSITTLAREVFASMRKKNFKGRCEKRILSKCAEVCRLYDPIQSAYANLLQESEEIAEIRCNVFLDGLELGDYTSDFVCVKSGRDLMVRECVFQNVLLKPMTIRLLDASREYWRRRGVIDWGVVVNAKI